MLVRNYETSVAGWAGRTLGRVTTAGRPARVQQSYLGPAPPPPVHSVHAAARPRNPARRVKFHSKRKLCGGQLAGTAGRAAPAQPSLPVYSLQVYTTVLQCTIPSLPTALV